MRHRLARQFVALLLAALVAAGMGLSAAQASGMAAKMATISEMGMSVHGDCQDCPDGSADRGMKAMACGTVCAAPAVAPLPIAALVPTGEKATPFAVGDLPLNGRALPPDPDPPRTSDIG